MAGMRRLGTLFDPIQAVEREFDRLWDSKFPQTIFDMALRRRMQRNKPAKQIDAQREFVAPPVDVIERDDSVSVVAVRPLVRPSAPRLI